MSNPAKAQVSQPSGEQGVDSILNSEWVMLGLDYAFVTLKLVLILVVGLIVSRIVSKAVVRIVDRLGLEVLAEKLGVARVLYKVGIREGVAKLSGRVSRWFGVFITVYVAVSQLGIEALTNAGARAFAYIPTLITALLMIGGGAWLSDKVKRLVLGDQADSDSPSSTRQFLAQVAALSILVMSVTMGLEHLGVEIELIHDIVLSVYGVLVLSAAVVFAFGAQQSMKQFIAGYYGRKLLRVGDSISMVGEDEGGYMIQSFTSMYVIAADANQQEVLIPYTEILGHSVKLVYEERASEKMAQE